MTVYGYARQHHGSKARHRCRGIRTRLIRVRTGECSARAKARGHMRGHFKLKRHQQRETIARREAGEALSNIGRTFRVHHTTIGRLRPNAQARNFGDADLWRASAQAVSKVMMPTALGAPGVHSLWAVL
jgi:hypothetical protein